MPKTRLEFNDGTSHKFWNINRAGATQTVSYGRIGTDGRTLTRDFDSLEDAKKSYDKLVAQKLNKGYFEAGKKSSRGARKKASANNSRPAKSAGKTSAATKSTFATRSSRKPPRKRAGKSSEPFFKPLSGQAKKYYEPLSMAVVKRKEELYGIKFPRSLLKLLKVQNGRGLSSPHFEFGRQSYELDEIPPIRMNGGLEPLTDQFPDHLEMAEGTIKDAHLIFPLCGDGHYFIALDYRNCGPRDEPRVIYLDIEGRPWQKKITDSFEEFLAGQCQPKELPRVHVDLADPDSLIGHAERKFVRDNPETGKPVQIEERHWLFLDETRIECFEYRNFRMRVGKEKFSEEPQYERWERRYAKLEDVTEVSITSIVKPKALDVSTSYSKLGVYYDTSERDKGKGWKNRRGGPIAYFYFHGTPKNMVECRAKIQKAIKKTKRG